MRGERESPQLAEQVDFKGIVKATAVEAARSGA